MAVQTLERPTRLYWWKEASMVIAFYLVYSMTRNRFGSKRVEIGEEPLHAFNNAIRIIDWERALNLFYEPTLQAWFLDFTAFLQFWNTFYGTAHFVVTAVAFVWLYRARPALFPLWRNVLGATTALAIVGFSLFPVMPPRLLDSSDLYGGARLEVAQDIEPYGFVDTLKVEGGPWSFDSGAMQKLSNQYAAMPSLHIAWSVWCVLVMWQLTRSRGARALIVSYPFFTLFGIVVTANHFLLDAVGGLLTLAVGYVIGRAIYEWNERRHGRDQYRSLDEARTTL
ncbi:MAG TPA: phosphatase PAP2 family protein [Acidimicrobiales bacterium]|nr:phosphatase PAP2 family protein [Acidimicrobiales bacterium]